MIGLSRSPQNIERLVKDLKVNVTNNAPATVTNTVTVSGGGEMNTSNDTATDVAVVTAKIVPPSVQILIPSDSSTVKAGSGNLLMMAMASPGTYPGVAVVFYANSSRICSAAASGGPQTCAWKIPYSTGTYQLRVTAYDAIGQTQGEASVSVKVD